LRADPLRLYVSEIHFFATEGAAEGKNDFQVWNPGSHRPIRASSLFEAPAICWPRWVPRCPLLSSRVVRRRRTGRVTAVDGSPAVRCRREPHCTPCQGGRSLVGVEDRLINGDDRAAERRRFQHMSDHSDEIDFRFGIGRAMARHRNQRFLAQDRVRRQAYHRDWRRAGRSDSPRGSGRQTSADEMWR
jgi:hypothetical protein